MKRYLLGVGLALVVAACGGSDSQSGGEYVAPDEPAYEAPAESGEFSEPSEIAAVLNANGVECELDGEPAVDVTGAYGQTCWLPDQSDQLAIDIYKDEQQQGEGVELLRANGWEVVEGNLWTVSTQRPATAQDVAEAMRNSS